jgi:hypothetical protein
MDFVERAQHRKSRPMPQYFIVALRFGFLGFRDIPVTSANC